MGVNHLGDWGTQFGKMIAAYKRWGDHDTVAAGGVDEMVKLYVRFNAEAKENEALNDEGRAWFKKIEDGDPEALEIFNWFKSVTLKDAERVYDMLGVKFDSYAGESFYNDKMQPIIDELRAKDLLMEDQGAQIVDLEPYGMPPGADPAFGRCDAVHHPRSGGREIPQGHLSISTSRLYVVAYQQDLHFRQLFKVLELMGYDWYKDCEHVAFGMVSYEGQTLSTREGRVVYLDGSAATRPLKRRAAIIEEKSPDLENKDDGGPPGGRGRGGVLRAVQQPHQGHRFLVGSRAEFRRRDRPVCACTPMRAAAPCCARRGECDAKPDFTALADPEAQDVVRLHRAVPRQSSEAALQKQRALAWSRASAWIWRRRTTSSIMSARSWWTIWACARPG